MAIKLHTCGNPKFGGTRHPCSKVRLALDEAGVEYEIVKNPTLRPFRKDAEAKTGQRKLPFIEFEDGRILREESADLVARVREGRLEQV